MAIQEDIKALLAKKAMTMTKLAELLTKNGKKYTVQSISKKLSNKTVKFEEIRNFLDIIGYEIEYKEKQV